MFAHKDLASSNLFNQLKNKLILFAGNRKLKIYGTLHCISGKRMKKENRVFFKNETEAISIGFRPCGHCLPDRYRKWKSN
jgi:methylphosphotriester-DNA--protein-cysteine methyltransferase